MHDYVYKNSLSRDLVYSNIGNFYEKQKTVPNFKHSEASFLAKEL